MAAKDDSKRECCCVQQFHASFEQFTKIHAESRRSNEEVQKQFMETMVLKMVESVKVSHRQTEILTEMIEMLRINGEKNQTRIKHAEYVQVGERNYIETKVKSEDDLESVSNDGSCSSNSSMFLESIEEYQSPLNRYCNLEHGYNQLEQITRGTNTNDSSEASSIESENIYVEETTNSKYTSTTDLFISSKTREEGGHGYEDIYETNNMTQELFHDSDPNIVVYNADSAIVADYNYNLDQSKRWQLTTKNRLARMTDCDHDDDSIYSDLKESELYENTYSFPPLPSLPRKKMKLPIKQKKFIDRILRSFVCGVGKDNHIYDDIM